MTLEDQFKVKVVGTEGGDVVSTNPNKPEYGSIMLEQNAYILKNNFLTCRRKVSFVAGTVEELQEYAERYNLKAGGEIDGRLYTIESHEPFYEGQQCKLNPSNGRACLVDGAMVWSKTFYDPDSKQKDQFLQGKTSEGDVVVQPRNLLMEALISSSIS